MTHDLSKGGIYFTAPAEVNTQQPMQLGVELPEEITGRRGLQVRYLAESVRREKVNGTLGFPGTTLGVAARFLRVLKETGDESLSS